MGKSWGNHGKIFVNGSFHGKINGKSTNWKWRHPKATQFQNLDFAKISVFPVTGNIGDSTMRTITSQKVQWSASEVNLFLMVLQCELEDISSLRNFLRMVPFLT